MNSIATVPFSGRFTRSESEVFIRTTSTPDVRLYFPGLHKVLTLVIHAYENNYIEYPSKSLGRNEFAKNVFVTGPG